MAKRKSKKKTSSVILTIVILAVLGLAKEKLNFNSSTSILEQLTTMIGKPNSSSNNSQTSNTTDLLSLNWDGTETGLTTTLTTAPFTKAELSLANGSWEKFSELDSLNRAGQANAMLGPDLLPTKERESSITWDPTGFKNKKVTVTTTTSNGSQKKLTEWLYNRCHLIGYQLTGQNTNPKNLVTGTRILNTPEMTNIENKVADYIKQTKHHVRYQVTPVYKDNELVCRGIQMKAQSIEDNTIKENCYIFNVQPGITINYADGTSKISK
jgi:DNA-entry nuclease